MKFFIKKSKKTTSFLIKQNEKQRKYVKFRELPSTLRLKISTQNEIHYLLKLTFEDLKTQLFRFPPGADGTLIIRRLHHFIRLSSILVKR